MGAVEVLAGIGSLQRLVEANARLWAGEAEVFAHYWTWSGRTRETDRTWLSRQCLKEFWGSGTGDERLGLMLGPVEELRRVFPEIDATVDRSHVLDVINMLRAEFAHYVAFADAHDAMALPGEERLNPHRLERWTADAELAALRYEHRRNHGAVGLRACFFTEGGYCTLFASGMELAGNGGRDDLIAAACRAVFDDEFEHMLRGIAGLVDEAMDESDWQLLEQLSCEQMRARIRMRNEQFCFPVPEIRMRQILQGACDPLPFDWARARLQV